MSKTLHNGEERWAPEWLKSVTEKRAIQSLRSTYDVNTIVKMWKIANGYSVPNYMEQKSERFVELMKLTKPKLVDLANDMELDFETDANKSVIAELIEENED